MADSSIEWTDAVWNPVRGCSVVSPGCTNCYAMKQAHRFGGPGGPYDGLTKGSRGGPVWSGEVRTVPSMLDAPLRWKRPRRVFVNSMSDLFHDDVPVTFIERVWLVMRGAPRHTFQILTKRAHRMRSVLSSATFGPDAVLPNVWLGVSVEDQVRANERIPLLLQTPAAVRWISAEPLLGPVDLERIQVSPQSCGAGPARINAARLLDWVVVGGESGPHARPFDLQWALEIVRQCNAADTPVFVKQIGSAPQQTVRRQDDPLRILVRDRKGGDPAEWPLDLRVREYPQMNGRPWTPADVKALRALYPITPTKALAKRFRRRTIAVHAKAWNLGLRKTPAYLAAASVECGRRLAIAGAATRFPPGHVPWTKSTHFCAGGRSAETRFKPGNVSKRWDPEAYVIGALRINADGDLDIKVANGLRAWRSMVRFTWETERGPIPPSTVVRTINGDRHDTRIENLRLATKREVMLENTLHNYPEPLARALQLRGALTRKINDIERKRSAKHA